MALEPTHSQVLSTRLASKSADSLLVVTPTMDLGAQISTSALAHQPKQMQLSAAYKLTWQLPCPPRTTQEQQV